MVSVDEGGMEGWRDEGRGRGDPGAGNRSANQISCDLSSLFRPRKLPALPGSGSERHPGAGRLDMSELGDSCRPWVLTGTPSAAIVWTVQTVAPLSGGLLHHLRSDVDRTRADLLSRCGTSSSRYISPENTSLRRVSFHPSEWKEGGSAHRTRKVGD